MEPVRRLSSPTAFPSLQLEEEKGKEGALKEGLREVLRKVRHAATRRSALAETRPYLGFTREEIRPRRFQSSRPEPWTWERWGRASERSFYRMARVLEMIFVGGVGALLGLAAASVPTIFLGYYAYPYMVAQPLGAAVGAIAGALLVVFRWVQKGHQIDW